MRPGRPVPVHSRPLQRPLPRPPHLQNLPIPALPHPPAITVPMAMAMRTIPAHPAPATMILRKDRRPPSLEMVMAPSRLYPAPAAVTCPLAFSPSATATPHPQKPRGAPSLPRRRPGIRLSWSSRRPSSRPPINRPRSSSPGKPPRVIRMIRKRPIPVRLRPMVANGRILIGPCPPTTQTIFPMGPRSIRRTTGNSLTSSTRASPRAILARDQVASNQATIIPSTPPAMYP